MLLRAFCFIIVAGTALAGVIENVQLDTTPLIGHAAGPFSLDFQLNGSAGNTATLSLFSFGVGGGPVGTPILVGGASGSLSSTVTLSETGFLNDFTQPFTPGTFLSFQLTLSQQAQQHGFPDEFTFAILDQTGAELPTTSFSDVFVDIDITNPPSVETFGSDPNRAPQGGGSPLHLAPPAVQPAAVPEPGTVVLCAATAFLAIFRRRRSVLERSFHGIDHNESALPLNRIES